MCKIDLPRKNMVIEREHARRRELGREGAGVGGFWESTHTYTHLHKSHVHRVTQMHTLERVQGKSAGLGGMKKNFLSLLLTSSPSH